MKELLRNFPRNFWISAAMSLFALILFAAFPSAHRGLALTAMLLSSFGDLALMNFRGFFSRAFRNAFVTGGILFMIAHLFYAAAFTVLLYGQGSRASLPGIGAALALGAILYVSLIIMARHRGCLRRKKALLLLLYAAFEFADCTAVFTACFALGIDRPQYLAGAVGIVLFIASDYFIGMDEVAGDRSLTKYIWLFYTSGQILMLLAA